MIEKRQTEEADPTLGYWTSWTTCSEVVQRAKLSLRWNKVADESLRRAELM
jgi:hypothetical protein